MSVTAPEMAATAVPELLGGWRILVEGLLWRLWLGD